MRDRVGISTMLLLWAACLLPSDLLAQEGAARSQGLEPIEITVERLADDATRGGLEYESAVDEEVVVVSRRGLVGLRAQILAAEDRVYALFNALNDDDQLDIHCYTETRTGTNISRRVCKPNYVDSATAVDGQSQLSALRSELGSAQMPSRTVIQSKDRILRDKLAALVNDNAELRDAVVRHAELRATYESARQQISDSAE